MVTKQLVVSEGLPVPAIPKDKSENSREILNYSLMIFCDFLLFYDFKKNQIFEEQ